MGNVLLAEASPCCPSPLFGQLVILAYIVGGAAVYIWMFSALFRWALHRHHRRIAAVDEDG